MNTNSIVRTLSDLVLKPFDWRKEPRPPRDEREPAIHTERRGHPGDPEDAEFFNRRKNDGVGGES